MRKRARILRRGVVRPAALALAMVVLAMVTLAVLHGGGAAGASDGAASAVGIASGSSGPVPLPGGAEVAPPVAGDGARMEAAGATSGRAWTRTEGPATDAAWQPATGALEAPEAPGADAGEASGSDAPTDPAMALAARAADRLYLAAAAASERERPSAARLAVTIAALLADAGETERLGLDRPALDALAKVYGDRGFTPLWAGEQGLRVGAATLIATFLRAGDDGLDPDDYVPPSVAGTMPSGARGLASADLALSAALVRYATDLKVGRLVPTRTDAQGNLLRKSVDAATVLAGAADASDLSGYLRSLAPPNGLYAGLRRSLAEYRRAAARGGWQAPAPDRLEPGSEGEPVAQVRAILRATGDFINFADDSDDAPFDETLAVAVQGFQARHGLNPDGVVGEETRAAMAVGFDERIRQILLNMERVRWLPEDLGDPHIMVNIAGFTLSYVQAGAAPVEMRAIVGKPARRSPEFSGLITYLDVNPSWSVPRIIAVEDLLPKIRKDPGFLAANGFSLRTPGGGSVDAGSIDWASIRADGFPYALRQRPGPGNALGRVKFMFPNSFDVYLHDTPARGLFAQPVRAYSSGCIRLEKPVELALKLLEANGSWTDEQLRRAIARGETRTITLSRPVPVHLTYLTSWREPDGTVQFRDDIYGRDRQMEAALAARESRLVVAGGPAPSRVP